MSAGTSFASQHARIVETQTLADASPSELLRAFFSSAASSSSAPDKSPLAARASSDGVASEIDSHSSDGFDASTSILLLAAAAAAVVDAIRASKHGG